MPIIDIKFNADDPRAARLSNFTARKFSFGGLQCNSIEGFLQSLKAEDSAVQKKICLLTGRDAWHAGRSLSRNDPAILYIRGRSFNRFGAEYFYILRSVYDGVYGEDPTFKKDLLATKHEQLCHSVGECDPRKTILTETEFLFQLYRLRERAHEAFDIAMRLQEALP